MTTLRFCTFAMILLLPSCSQNGPSNGTATSSSMWASIPSAAIIRAGTTFSASPNPIMVPTTPRTGATTLSWHAPVAKVEIHLGSPDGKVFVSGGSDGHARTGPWVANNTIFYLQDATASKPTDLSARLPYFQLPSGSQII